MHFSYKFFLIITLLCIKVNLSQSWNFIGGPQGIFPNDVIFLSNGRVLCSTYNGVFISDDFGDNWKISKSSQNFKGIFSLTERYNGEVIAVSRFGIVKSFDKGENWVKISDLSYLNDYAVRFRESIIDSSLYFVKNGQLNRSTDGGYNWSIVWDSNNDSQVIDDIMIDESGFIYLAVRYNNIFRSKDNGKSFQSLNTGYDLKNSFFSNLYPDKHGGFYFFINEYNAKIVHVGTNKVDEINIYSDTFDIPLGITSAGNLIYKYGQYIALFNASTGRSELLSTPFFVKPQYGKNMVAFGNIWIVNFQVLGLYRSNDGGGYWKDINTGLGYKQCLSMYITDSGKMLVSTFNAYFWGGLFNSVDDGKTWSQINPIEDPYFINICKLKNGNLIGAGGSGVFIADKDGNNWTQTRQYDYSSSILVSKDGLIYVGTYEDGILISRDNGNTWSSQTIMGNSYFTALGESTSGRIFATGLYDAGTFYSDDEGKTWNHINSDLLTYSSVNDFICKNDTLFAGTASGLLYSMDNGLNWSFSNQIPGSVTKLAQLSNGDFVAVVPGMGILRNINNTGTWESLGNDLNDRDISNIFFDKYSRIYAVTDSGIFRNDQYVHPFIISPPIGATKQRLNIQLQWNSVPSTNRYEIQLSNDSLFSTIIKTLYTTENSIKVGTFIPDKTYYWRVKASTTLFNDVVSDVGKFTTALPYSFSQNYPNPFNNETSLKFYIPYTSQVRLYVYNILGELISKLLDKEMFEGTYEFHWDASNLSSGMYLLKFESGDFIQVRKTILLK